MLRLLFILLTFVSCANAADFDVVLMDNPAVKVTFDRKYEAFKITKKKGASATDPLVYMMMPEDQQSAVTLGIGDGLSPKTEETISQMYEGAKVTKVNCTIGGVKGQWWHYRDSRHLYSSCTIKAPRPNKPPLVVIIDLVANTPERLASLEASFSGLMIVENPPNKRPEGTPGKSSPSKPSQVPGVAHP